MKDFEKFDLYKKGETITSDNTLSPTPTPKEEPKCPTCGKPYKSSDPIFCSNSFHVAPSEEVKPKLNQKLEEIRKNTPQEIKDKVDAMLRDRWISVKDKLPPDNLNYLAYQYGFDIYVAMYARATFEWFDDAGNPCKPTHWMELPIAPVLE